MARTLKDHLISTFVREQYTHAQYTDFQEAYPTMEIIRANIPNGSNIIKIFIHDGLRDEGLCFIISTDGRTNRTYWREVNPVSLVDIESMQSKMFCNLIEAAMDLESYLMINYEQCIWDLVYEIKS